MPIFNEKPMKTFSDEQIQLMRDALVAAMIIVSEKVDEGPGLDVGIGSLAVDLLMLETALSVLDTRMKPEFVVEQYVPHLETWRPAVTTVVGQWRGWTLGGILPNNNKLIEKAHRYYSAGTKFRIVHRDGEIVRQFEIPR